MAFGLDPFFVVHKWPAVKIYFNYVSKIFYPKSSRALKLATYTGFAKSCEKNDDYTQSYPCLIIPRGFVERALLADSTKLVYQIQIKRYNWEKSFAAAKMRLASWTDGRQIAFEILFMIILKDHLSSWKIAFQSVFTNMYAQIQNTPYTVVL